ncbi:porin [Marivirga arenosa]|uniref:Porin n=1 Tax=Marivirga arenosa TaxID=3059076 RepID=A0AA49GJH8_9BACT|nr:MULTISPECIES: porin [unclassified Marivirga]WKK87468.2 porin [Marivirga sp. ABR2-2]WNB18492.1 porin [Marivirga sp. BKB1-2]
MKKLLLFLVTIIGVCSSSYGFQSDTTSKELKKEKKWDELTQQEVDHSYKSLTVKLTEDGAKYVRFILWHQQWLQTSNLAIEDAPLRASTSIRRSRVLAFAQISPRFLILTHFGLNNLSTANMSALGNNGDGPQLFLHDAWTEFKLFDNSEALFIGAGLHYWKGLTRLANQSTLNFMTMDNTRPFVQWHSLGITDQFARHMGFYAKGQIGNFDYRIAANNPLNPANALGLGSDLINSTNGGNDSDLVYQGSVAPDTDGNPVGNTIIEGYFRYNFLDKESTKLPYQVGTYMGSKQVLGVGLGFFAHPKGMFNTVSLEHSNVTHLAADVFYDAPIGSGGNAINAYASIINFNYGENYMSRWAGTGTNIYGQLGYFIRKAKLMPYVAFQSGNYQAYNDNLNAFDAGVNYFVNGHNAKITLEYHTISNNPLEGGLDADGNPNGVQQLRLQLHIFL